MLLNANTALSTTKALLVPYSPRHVPRYHEWMQDEEIQEATASEPLTLDEEYAMQRSWRLDPDKLTFIICRPIHIPIPPYSEAATSTSTSAGVINNINTAPTLTPEDDSPPNMIGDINLFLRIDDGDEGDSAPQLIGEIELMVAEKANQRRGFGRAALLIFLRYIAEHESGILAEFVRGGIEEGGKGRFGLVSSSSTATAFAISGKAEGKGTEESEGKVGEGEGKNTGLEFSYLSVKIGQSNTRSLALFESLGFSKVSDEPNFFGEFELRRANLETSDISEEMYRVEVEGYSEIVYRPGE
ncbi:hypothetical protein N7510_007213 [Penicillium lagena]|uniref:uncharacterized protein n=1 Tax=Penicillium lagena TaxID=94218 RepID=UPI002540B48F|nr:uncharacterized protein N7510_007213 [Penicillium lagena]KAJ5610494.1 hypothetical protein N7510_007213 [Penicillium lagena]